MLARTEFLLTPDGVNNEGFPSSAPANGPSVDHGAGSTTVIDNNHLHANPYPFVAAPGQSAVCEAGNESYTVGQKVTTNLPSGVSANREFTSREQNLFGETYKPEVLKALGIKVAGK